jgi:hypothetical protein
MLARIYTAVTPETGKMTRSLGALMLDLNLVSANCVRHYSVTLTGEAGWEAKTEEGTHVLWRETYEDWHRVERTVARLEREVSELLTNGWTIQAASR